MENFIITVSFLLIGMVVRRLPDFSQETGKVLNMFVIYLSLPALVFVKIPGLVFSRDLLVPLGNTSFLGIPMVKAFFGDQAVPYAIIYDQLGSFLALATYGSLILALYGTGGSKPTVRSVLRKIGTFPPFVALVLAVLLRPFPYPAVAVSLLKTLSSTLVPLVMIAVGFQLTLRLSREATSQLFTGLSIKLVAAPVAAWFLFRTMGLAGEAVRVSVFEAGMPPMVSAGALAMLANLSPQLTAALVGVGIVSSFAASPLLYSLIM